MQPTLRRLKYLYTTRPQISLKPAHVQGHDAVVLQSSRLLAIHICALQITMPMVSRTIGERLMSAQDVALLCQDVFASEGDLLSLPRVYAVLPMKYEKLEYLQQMIDGSS